MNTGVRRVKLTPEQKAATQRDADSFARTLAQQARNDSDPETQTNARVLCAKWGIAY